MDFAPFIYTRTFCDDHRLVAKPSSNFCTLNIFEDIQMAARKVINEDNALYGDINEARWCLYSLENYFLYGAGIRNKSFFEKEYAYDDTLTRLVRGFFGIIIPWDTCKLSPLELPFGVAFIQYLFHTFVKSHWYEKGMKEYNHDFLPYNSLPGNICKISGNGNLKELNIHPKKIRLYPKNRHDDRYLLACAMAHLPNKISLVTGLNVRKHACDTRFINAVVADVSEIEEHELPKEIASNYTAPSPKEQVGSFKYSNPIEMNIPGKALDEESKEHQEGWLHIFRSKKKKAALPQSDRNRSIPVAMLLKTESFSDYSPSGLQNDNSDIDIRRGQNRDSPSFQKLSQEERNTLIEKLQSLILRVEKSRNPQISMDFEQLINLLDRIIL